MDYPDCLEGRQKLEIFQKLAEDAYYLKNLLCCDTSFGQQLES